MGADLAAALAMGLLVAHLGFIVWVVFGALVTCRRQVLAGLHVASLLYGIAIEMGPWPCPLTQAENWFEARAGIVPYGGPFLLHYLDALIYPNVLPALLT